jgi:hypothetical protein
MEKYQYILERDLPPLANESEIRHIKCACDQRTTAHYGGSAKKALTQWQIPEVQLRGAISRHILAGKRMFRKFKNDGSGGLIPDNVQANRWQAIHIAFALIGDTTRAREALMKARHAAELLGLAEDIFTVKNYTNLPVDGFIQITDEMLAALDRGHLWDGMPLPQSAS